MVDIHKTLKVIKIDYAERNPDVEIESRFKPV